MPDDGMVSFLGRVNQNKNLEILQPNLEQDLVQWIGNHEDYIEFKFIEKEMVSEVFEVFNTYKNTILENADKIVNQEYSSLKLEQQARTFAALLRKTVDINNVKLFYSSEQNRTAFAYGFSFIDAELMDFAASINPDDLVDKPNLTSPIIASAVEENEFPAVVTPLPPNVKKNRNNKHPWWINTIRSINWFAWKYWWLVWLLFILSFLLLYFFCPSKKKTSNSTCNELNHIHKNIDTLNGGLLYCCDCRREIPPIENDSIPALDSNEIFLPADFILITYQFDASGGKDLDTRTNVESPTRGDVIGYCKPSRSSSNIVWSGDNTAYGVESVYVDINKYGSTDLIKILCKAFWYSQRNSGNMSLDIRAYKGGAMQRDRSNHYQFINVGGEQVGDVISFPKNIIMKGANCMTGEIIGTVKYNRANQSLSFE
jgi:hypothetical protein